MSENSQPSAASESTEARLRHEVELLTVFALECAACQQQAAPHWQFCSHCGSRLATACPGCDSPLPPLGARFCPHCALELPEDLWPR